MLLNVLSPVVGLLPISSITSPCGSPVCPTDVQREDGESNEVSTRPITESVNLARRAGVKVPVSGRTQRFAEGF